MTKYNKQKNSSTSPSYKLEDSKKISISPGINSFLQNKPLMLLKSKMICSWIQSLKSRGKSLIAKNLITKTKIKFKPSIGKETTFRNNFSNLKLNSNNTTKNSFKEKSKLQTTNKKSAKEISQLRISTNKSLKFKRKKKAMVKKLLWPMRNICKLLSKSNSKAIWFLNIKRKILKHKINWNNSSNCTKMFDQTETLTAKVYLKQKMKSLNWREDTRLWTIRSINWSSKSKLRKWP